MRKTKIKIEWKNNFAKFQRILYCGILENIDSVVCLTHMLNPFNVLFSYSINTDRNDSFQIKLHLWAIITIKRDQFYFQFQLHICCQKIAKIVVKVNRQKSYCSWFFFVLSIYKKIHNNITSARLSYSLVMINSSSFKHPYYMN